MVEKVSLIRVSNVNTKIYHMASLLGLIPGQLVGIYVGQSLRSMQDVLENQKHFSYFTYVFAAAQLIFSVILMVWLSAKARRELAQALLEAETKFGNTEKTMALTNTLSMV
ncbi:protein maelstrom isoform X2 [Agrilus planipennis]|uniref:Protein maelstrom isoform X2 n=1 Tax=Agrilus planipennis TaxID=224129 RepID=A0A1W4XCA2_AGRPL|nr:protein maelstrom isoform X2 [Agrilus planipennis]